MLDQFSIERVGGGLSILGFFVATPCYIFLIIMGLVFLLGGSLLSVIAFVPRKETDWTYDLHKSIQSRVLGPLLICIGVLASVVGAALILINKKLRNGEKLVRKSKLYTSFSNNSSFSGMPSQAQSHSPDQSLSSLTLESMTGGGKNYEREESFTKEESLADIACFPLTAKQQNTTTVDTPFIDIPEICVTQPSPHPAMFDKTKKKRRNSFRLRHKVGHDIGATSIEIPATRRASYHGDSVELSKPGVRTPSPDSLPVITALYLSSKSRNSSPEPGIEDCLEHRDWAARQWPDSPTVDTDSIRINLHNLQE